MLAFSVLELGRSPRGGGIAALCVAFALTQCGQQEFDLLAEKRAESTPEPSAGEGALPPSSGGSAGGGGTGNEPDVCLGTCASDADCRACFPTTVCVRGACRICGTDPSGEVRGCERGFGCDGNWICRRSCATDEHCDFPPPPGQLASPICSPKELCVECFTDEHCTIPDGRRLCVPELGACVECRIDRDCPPGQTCGAWGRCSAP